MTSFISKFIEEHVFPHETEMCFYMRKKLPVYDQSMNTLHEGHHNGIKKSPLGLISHHSVVRSTKKLITMSYYSAMKFGKKNIDFLNQTQLWSNTPTYNNLTTWIEVIIMHQIGLVNQYDIVRTNKKTWYCKSKITQEKMETLKKIPIFHRVRKITKSEEGILHCSCCFTERFRLPCRHILLVNNGEIKLSDVCVRNTVIYGQQYGDQKFQDETKKFDEKISNYKGPYYHPTEETNIFYPVYHCSKSSNENMAYFNHGVIGKIHLLNYKTSEYSIDDEEREFYSTQRNENNIGFSQEHSCVEDDVDSIDSSHFYNDAFPHLNPIMKEIVETVGSDKYLYLHAEKK